MAPFDLTGPYDIHRDGVPDPLPPNTSPPGASPLAIVTNHLLLDLTEQREGLIVYLLGKAKSGDWHAVQDAASDIREVDAQIALLKELRGGG